MNIFHEKPFHPYGRLNCNIIMLTLNVHIEGTAWYEIRIAMIRYSGELIQIIINTTMSTIQKNKKT